MYKLTLSLFDKKLSFLIVLLCLPLLFLPKINLISIHSETAGVRIDDLILFMLGILIIWAHFLYNHKLYQIEFWLFAFTAFSFISFISNKILVQMDLLYMPAKIFYTIRLFEYFIFFYIGAFAAQFFQTQRIVQAFFLWNLCIMILQKIGLTGGLSVEGYQTDVSSRVQGIASFPSEMGLLLNLIFCYLIYDTTASSLLNFVSPPFKKILKKFYLYGMFCLFGAFVIFTGNRISILALLVCFLFKLKQELNWRSMSSFVTIFMISMLLLGGVVWLMFQTASVYDRSTALFSFKNLELVQIVWNKIDLTQDPIENEVISSDHFDVSWWLRAHKWVYVLKAYCTNPLCYLQGVGPGFAWSALDGGFLRILVEYGIIGFYFFYKFLACLYRINPQIKWMVIAFYINMIFFDAYLAYKTMSFLLFTAGYAFQRQQQLLRGGLKTSLIQV